METRTAVRVLIVPRWNGRPASDWYPWFVEHAGQHGGEKLAEVRVLDMPNPHVPTIADWVPAIAAALGSDANDISRTVVIGHSVGCQAALRALAMVPASSAVRGFIAVAGWWAVDEPWESLLPWQELDFDLAAARRAAGRVVTLLSTNDHFTPDHHANADLWRKRMGATVAIVPGVAHFNNSPQPAVWDALAAHFLA